MKIAKNIIKKASFEKKDPFLALLSYRNTPMEGLSYSPAEQLIGRRTRTILPTVTKSLEGGNINMKMARTELKQRQGKMCLQHSSQREGNKLNPGDRVYTKLDHETKWIPATIRKKHEGSERSYIIEPNGSAQQFRRNEKFLHKVPKDTHASETNAPTTQTENGTSTETSALPTTREGHNQDWMSMNTETQQRKRTPKLSMFGRILKSPDRLNYE